MPDSRTSDSPGGTSPRWLLLVALAGCAAMRPPAPPVPPAPPSPPVGQVSVPASAPSFAAEPALRVVDVRRAGDASGARVAVQLSRAPIGVRPFELNGPPRCVVDLAGPVDTSQVQQSLATGDPLVPRVRVGSDADRVRVVVDLGSGAERPCVSRLDGTALVVAVGPRPAGAPAEVVWTSSTAPDGATAHAAFVLAGETGAATPEAVSAAGRPVAGLAPGPTPAGEQPVARAASAVMPSAGEPVSAVAPDAAPVAGQPIAPTAPLAEYRIGRGDHLAIKFFYTPELNEEVVVRPDGNISLQLIGDVPVAGRTPPELSAEIKQRYEPQVKTRDVTVIVRDVKSARAFVGGEVRQPAVVPIDGAMTVADAIFVAGGALDTAKLGSVVLLRMGPSGKETHLVDVSAGLYGEEPLPTLQPYDVVYVPKSAIAEVDTFVELYVNRLLPRNSGFFAYYQINPLSTTPQP